MQLHKLIAIVSLLASSALAQVECTPSLRLCILDPGISLILILIALFYTQVAETPRPTSPAQVLDPAETLLVSSSSITPSLMTGGCS